MKKLLFIDGCMRGKQSRTRKLAAAFLSALPEEYEVERVDVDALDILPLTHKALDHRNELIGRSEYGHTMFAFARQFAVADAVMVAAPFWDMGIPAKLKTYFEHVSVAGITFEVKENGDCVGCCRAKRLVYLTTRGMEIEDGSVMEQASPYLNALALFFGIDGFDSVSAWGLDMNSEEEVKRRLSLAEDAARELAKTL